MSLFERLQRAASLGLIRDLDLHFARFMGELGGSASEGLVLGACLVSRQTGEGDVCIELPALAGQAVLGADAEAQGATITAPRLADWREMLEGSRVVGRPGDDRPLVLDEHDRLYLARYWRFESDLADDLLARIARRVEPVNRSLLEDGLTRLFPRTGSAPDWQKIAAAVALLKPFAVISGGPGTGKTRTVTSILALLVEQSHTERPRIGLVAPTGKAAARLSESIKREKQGLACEPRIKAAIPDAASTIHRLLKPIRGRPAFRHEARNPLHLDALVVDEASMVDLPLMARLVAALPNHARLILLGDKDQLASVEAGSVLGDICGRVSEPAISSGFAAELDQVCGESLGSTMGETRGCLKDSIVLLRHSYRFTAESGIGNLAQAVNRGEGQETLDILRAGDSVAVAFRSPRAAELPAWIANTVARAYASYLKETDPLRALEAFNRYRVLCAVREGPFGVQRINRQVELALRAKGLIRSEARWYAGRPVLITRNDYGLNLFNGDIGVLLPDPDLGGDTRAFFSMPDGSVRKILPSRLPEHETVYAMTVHKSQGSEFDRVLLVLPSEDSRVVTRELIYTGITRARSQIEIWGTPAALESAVHRRIQRATGLQEKLWGLQAQKTQP